MRITAQGYFIVIHPTFNPFGAEWYVVLCDRNGDWRSGSLVASKEAAKKRRSELFAIHRKLKRDSDRRAARRRK